MPMNNLIPLQENNGALPNPPLPPLPPEPEEERPEPDLGLFYFMLFIGLLIFVGANFEQLVDQVLKMWHSIVGLFKG